jgi:predicted TIM-barrel fold metal-dependent hydrolase
VSAPSAATDRYVVVSSDTHTGPSVERHLRRYCDAKHLATFDEFAVELEARNTAESQMPHVVALFGREAQDEYPRELLERRYWHAHVPGIDDPHARLRDLDADGIAAEIIYHGALNGEPVPFSSTGLRAWSSQKYSALEPVGVHIYNRWLADFVSVEPARHVGTAHIPISDVDAAVREVEWARSAGLTAVNLPAPRRDFPSYLDPVWEPFWAACSANEMVLNTHAGAGETMEYPPVPAAAAMYFVENPFFCRRAMFMLIFSGVFARYPNLRLVLTEQSCDWVPEAITDLDSTYFNYHNAGLRKLLPEPARHYFLQNCFIGASFMARHEVAMAIEHGLEDKFMWGSDYPHPEGTWPRTLTSLRNTFHDTPQAVNRKLLGDNAVAVYRLDPSALVAVAERVGPSVADIATPPSDVPTESDGYAFRTMGKWA